MIAIRLTILVLLACGLGYPLLMTGVAQVLFPYQSAGSLIAARDRRPLGSMLIGQAFEGPQWFHGRPSAVDYRAESSGASNLGPTNRKLIARVTSDVERLRAENPTWGDRPVPVDLVTETGSGLDPHISPESARLQAPRVAHARNIGLDEVNSLIDAHTALPDLGVFGAPRVNVLALNLALIR